MMKAIAGWLCCVNSSDDTTIVMTVVNVLILDGNVRILFYYRGILPCVITLTPTAVMKFYNSEGIMPPFFYPILTMKPSNCENGGFLWCLVYAYHRCSAVYSTEVCQWRYYILVVCVFYAVIVCENTLAVTTTAITRGGGNCLLCVLTGIVIIVISAN